ncbi:maltodextrin glucosidase [Reinekea sp.]|jgi:alpha-glucosidase|uniref:maltodextrin glucosidase n=1 Tax=Reinekea sp. TaxID=1970455 RepID=UPI002A7F1D72|nr:maltodextrin glucosidase [Reinekea sp.]
MSLIAFHEAIPGYLEDRSDQLWLRIAVNGVLPERVYARIEPDNEERLLPMALEGQQGSWSFYTALVEKSQHIDQTEYLFKLIWQHGSSWLGSAGVEPHMPRTIHMYRYSHDRRLPTWSGAQIFYQVFPERFAQGDGRLKPQQGEYRYLNRNDIVIKEWGDEPDWRSGGFEFFGGDLIGVYNKLDYLNDRLGVTALYLNPVFESQSSHKYDTVDYFNVDPHFGGNLALQQLIEGIHLRGMRIVLDAVINHTSLMHPWFQAALAGDERQRAKYVFGPDNEYSSWKDHDSLPTLDFANPDVVAQMITGSDSVIRHWLQPPYNIDGWRMDVIHMIGEGRGAKNNAHHVRTLRNVIKSENSEAMLLGEHFFEASRWLQGDQEDCAMNYFGFGHPVRAFFAGLDIAFHPIQLSAAQFARWLREARAGVSFERQLLQFNQLDSHDTPRFLSMLQDDRALLQVAIGFLMTYIGTPCLYYGTEIGMVGDQDPGCRRCFPWDESQWDSELLDFCTRWIGYRKAYQALSAGALIDLFAEQDVMVFARVSEHEQCLVVVNRGAACDLVFDLNIPGSAAPWQRVEAHGDLAMHGSQCQVVVSDRSVQLWSRQL